VAAIRDYGGPNQPLNSVRQGEAADPVPRLRRDLAEGPVINPRRDGARRGQVSADPVSNAVFRIVKPTIGPMILPSGPQSPDDCETA